MGSGAICPMCDRHYDPPECRCGYQEGPPDLKRLTRVTPRARATDDHQFSEPHIEALRRLEPDQRARNRAGFADARASLANARRRAGWMREVENVATGGRL